MLQRYRRTAGEQRVGNGARIGPGIGARYRYDQILAGSRDQNRGATGGLVDTGDIGEIHRSFAHERQRSRSEHVASDSTREPCRRAR